MTEADDGSMTEWMSLGFIWTPSTASGGGAAVGAPAPEPQPPPLTHLPGEGFRDGVYYVGKDEASSPLSSVASSSVAQVRSVSPLSMISVGSVECEPDFPPPLLDAVAQRAMKLKFKGELSPLPHALRCLASEISCGW